MPKMLQRGGASSLHNATEDCDMPIPLETARGLANDLQYVLVCDIPDSASSNVRKKLKTMQPFEHLPNIFYFDTGCDVHIVTTIMRNTSIESDLRGHVRSVSYLAHVTQHHNAMLKQLRTMVDSELLWYEGLEPLEPWVAFTKAGQTHGEG